MHYILSVSCRGLFAQRERGSVGMGAHLTSWGLSHHGLIWWGELRGVEGSRAVDGYPIDGTEGGVGKVQVQPSDTHKHIVK